MQLFDDNEGQRRIINIRNMQEKDIPGFCSQILKKDAKKKRAKDIKQDLSNVTNSDKKWILTLETKAGTIFGKMDVDEVSDDTAKVCIEIPNEWWIIKYGPEAIDQFVKICRNMKYFSVVEIEESKVMELYKSQRSLTSNRIVIA